MEFSDFLNSSKIIFDQNSFQWAKTTLMKYVHTHKNQYECIKNSEEKIICMCVTQLEIKNDNILKIQTSLGLAISNQESCTIDCSKYLNDNNADFEQNKNLLNTHVLILQIDQISNFNHVSNLNFLSNYIMHISSNQHQESSLDNLIVTCQRSYDDIFLLKAILSYFGQINIKISQEDLTHAIEASEQNKQMFEDVMNYFYKKFKPTGFNDQQKETSEDRINSNILDHANFMNLLSKFGLSDISKFSSLNNQEQIIVKLLTVFRYICRTTFFKHQFCEKSIQDPLKTVGFKIMVGKFWQNIASNSSNTIMRNIFDPMIAIIPSIADSAFSEIFVFSHEMEGIHIKHNFVARGGIRFSSRSDYRREASDLANTQKLKNVVVVPDGSKGCFIIKDDPNNSQCITRGYRSFVNEFIEITDTISSTGPNHPTGVICYDIPIGEKLFDEYIVVAADKGTSGFVDLANEISLDNAYWMSDSFASGGKNGYNHKGIGITSKGLMECVNNRLDVLGIDKNSPLSICGIGSMSGDVFGNAIMLIENPKLIACFDSGHVIINPNPNIQKDKAMFKHMFENTLNWGHYDIKNLSHGGIFASFDETVSITQECIDALKIEGLKAGDVITGRQLIPFILKADVDILLNGGIGTFIKSSTENNVAANDSTNDDIRVNSNQIRAKVIAEGGNLGMTFEARIEAGNKFLKNKTSFTFTDSIDNSGGVNCSDHEVNLKLLLSSAIIKHKIDIKKRNEILKSLERYISSKIKSSSFMQSMQIINYSTNSNHYYFEENINSAPLDLIFDNSAMLDINKKISSSKNIELTPSHISYLILISKFVAKSHINQIMIEKSTHNEIVELLDSKFIQKYTEMYFPNSLLKEFAEEIDTHRFKIQIFTSQFVNNMIDLIGFDFIFSSNNHNLIYNLHNSIKNYYQICSNNKLHEIVNRIDISSNFDNNIKQKYAQTIQNLRNYNFKTLNKLCVKNDLIQNSSTDADLQNLILIEM